MAKLIRTQVLLPEPMLEDLRWLAAERGRSVSGLVRKLVADKMGRIKKQILAFEAMRLMVKKAYTGKVPLDLSSNDSYLYGKAR